MRGFIKRWAILLLVAVTVHAPVIMVLSWLLDNFDVGGFTGAVVLAIVLGILLTVTYPLTLKVSFRFPPIVFVVVSFILTIAAFHISLWIVNQIINGSDEINGVGDEIIVILVVMIFHSFATAIWAVQDDEGYYGAVRTGLRKRHEKSTFPRDIPGLIIVEIDGLARPILEEALAGGYMPTVKRWIEDGSHILEQWEPDLSSQTSASQAGILMGSNENIPGFRWWSKEHNRPEVSSSGAIATALEARLSNGDGLLKGGASRWNVFTGDAEDALATFSTVRGRNLRSTAGAVLYISSPLSLGRTFGTFFAEVCRERWQAWQQVRKNVTPRIHRGWKYALVRAATNAPMQDMNFFMLTSDMIEGIPVVYSTFFAYDEVAHHSGIRSEDAFKVLRTLDNGIAILEKTSKEAHRPYRIAVIADHGQSQGAPYEHRYGHSLKERIAELVGEGRRVHAFGGQSESVGSISASMGTLFSGDSTESVATQSRIERGIGTLNLDPDKHLEIEVDPADEVHDPTQDIVVMASGNLGLVSFTKLPGRVSLEEIDERYPALLEGLATDPGVSFVMVHAREGDEAVVIGPKGRRYLKADRLEGEDPLAKFKPTTRQHLLRTDGFSNCPDIIAISIYEPETGVTAAFEPLLGNHGGLGGTQQEPFVLHPADLEFPHEPVVGAGSLHKVLKGWARMTFPPELAADGNGANHNPGPDPEAATIPVA